MDLVCEKFLEIHESDVIELADNLPRHILAEAKHAVLMFLLSHFFSFVVIFKANKRNFSGSSKPAWRTCFAMFPFLRCHHVKQ